MKKNQKKMIVMLGIVLGFTCMAVQVQLGVYGWIPKGSLYLEYKEACEHINGVLQISHDGNPEGISGFYGICVCKPGYVNQGDKCVPADY